MKTTLTHNDVQYTVGQLVAEAINYRLYFCIDDKKQQFLLQVATATEHNGSLDRSAFILKELKQSSDLAEIEYAKLGTNDQVGYDLLFPELVDSFICNEQGKRRINILTFKGIDKINSVAPLSNLFTKDKLRLSLKTSAWIMGRLLKLIFFAHAQGISIRQLGGRNVLIEPEHHRVMIFDWTTAFYHQEEVPRKDRIEDISNAAKTVFGAIGGDVSTGKYPYDDKDNKDNQYTEFIWNLVTRHKSDAESAHKEFYVLVHNLFGRGYVPSEFLPL